MSQNVSPLLIDWRHDVPTGEGEGFIHSGDGLYFHFRRGTLLLHSHVNPRHSGLAVCPSRSGYNLWNQLNGVVDLKGRVVTIHKEWASDKNGRDVLRQRSIADRRSLQGALRRLSAYGVEGSFRLKGLPAEFPKTVDGFLSLTDPTDEILAGRPVALYHGTSALRANEILRFGLLPGQTPDTYTDLIPGYSERNVYLANTRKGAEFYGKRQAMKDRDDAFVILEVRVMDAARLLADDRFAVNGTNDPDGRKLAKSGRESGEFAYRGRISPLDIRIADTRRYTGPHACWVVGDRVHVDGRTRRLLEQSLESREPLKPSIGATVVKVNHLAPDVARTDIVIVLDDGCEFSVRNRSMGERLDKARIPAPPATLSAAPPATAPATCTPVAVGEAIPEIPEVEAEDMEPCLAP